MNDDRRKLESLNPEPGGGSGWAQSEAGRRAYERVFSRLGSSAIVEPHRSRIRAWAIAAPAVAVLLAIGLPLLFLRGGPPAGTTAGPAATPTTTTTATPPTTLPPTTTAPVAEPTEYAFVGSVLDKEGVGPQLCSVLEESLPPQCRGVPVEGLDWADLPWAETAGDTTWAVARLVGTFDGEVFTLTRPPAQPGEGPSVDYDFSSPCPQPAGGWAVTDAALATQADFDAATAYAYAQPDYAGLWITQLAERPSEVFDPAAVVLNARFTGDVAGHQADLEEIYGGPLCVTGAERTEAELNALLEDVIQALSTPEARAAGIYATLANYSTDIVHQVVVAEVFLATESGQAWVDQRLGAGAVELRSLLIPADGS